VSVPALEQELASGRATKRKTAKNKRTGTESEILLSLLSLESNDCDPIELSERLSRDFQMQVGIRSGSRKHSLTGTTGLLSIEQGTPRVFPRDKCRIFASIGTEVFDHHVEDIVFG